MNGSKAFDESGKLINEITRKKIETHWHAFKEWIETQRPAVLKSQGLEDSPWIQH